MRHRAVAFAGAVSVGSKYAAGFEEANAKTLGSSARGHAVSRGCGGGGADDAGGCAVFLILPRRRGSERCELAAELPGEVRLRASGCSKTLRGV